MLKMARYCDLDDGDRFVIPEFPLHHAIAYVSYYRLVGGDPTEMLHFSHKEDDTEQAGYFKFWDDAELVICYDKDVVDCVCCCKCSKENDEEAE